MDDVEVSTMIRCILTTTDLELSSLRVAGRVQLGMSFYLWNNDPLYSCELPGEIIMCGPQVLVRVHYWHLHTVYSLYKAVTSTLLTPAVYCLCKAVTSTLLTSMYSVYVVYIEQESPPKAATCFIRWSSVPQHCRHLCFKHRRFWRWCFAHLHFLVQRGAKDIEWMW